jgi:branched-chain amino acid transport system permease protein
MQAVIDSLVSVVTGVFTLGEADLMTIGINMIMALSMFLPMTVGQLSFGQAGFMSIGAHIAVVLTLYAGVSFPIALLVAGLGSGLVGFLVGVPVLRLRGLLLALVTFAFAQVVEVFFLNFRPTGAAEGIRGIYPHSNLWFVFGFLALLVIFLARLRRSRMGRAFEAVKLDETAAEAMGINVTRAKLTAFAAGAFVAGVGGGLYAHHAVFIQYDNFDFRRSVDIAMYMVLGGMDVLYGPLLGAFIITYLSTALQFLADWRWEVWGSIVILVMIFRPQGILGRDTLNIRRWLRPRKEVVAGT